MHRVNENTNYQLLRRNGEFEIFTCNELYNIREKMWSLEENHVTTRK